MSSSKIENKQEQKQEQDQDQKEESKVVSIPITVTASSSGNSDDLLNLFAKTMARTLFKNLTTEDSDTDTDDNDNWWEQGHGLIFAGPSEFLLDYLKKTKPSARQRALQWREPDGYGLISLISASNNIEALRYLVSDWNIDLRDLGDMCPHPLILAARNSANDVVDYYFGLLMDPFRPTFLFKTSPGRDCKMVEDALLASILFRNNLVASKILVEFSCKMLTDNNRYSSNGTSAALYAVKTNNLEIVKKMANYDKVDFTQVASPNGDTAAQWAAFVGALDVLLWLIENYDLDVNAYYGTRRRLLVQEAIENHKFVTVCVLVKLGANLSLRLCNPGDEQKHDWQFVNLWAYVHRLATKQWKELFCIFCRIDPMLKHKTWASLCGNSSAVHIPLAEFLRMDDPSFNPNLPSWLETVVFATFKEYAIEVGVFLRPVAQHDKEDDVSENKRINQEYAGLD